ncbi:MAG TPA: pilus assembly protein PilM [Planctomycetota bacterium]|nr:pilus assembly protein PilM [Planctomycetota bacterium]
MATGLGIDIGSESIKIVQARVSGGTVTVTAALKLSRAGDVALDAPVPEDQAGTNLVPPHLGEELKKAGLRRAGTLGVAGREVVLKYLALPPMPPPKMKMAIDMEIGGKLTPKGRSADPDAPEMTYDYRILNLPSGGLKGDLVIMAGVCKNSYLFNVNESLKTAGISPNEITPSSFGLVNAYLRTQKIPENETVVLVDVGHELLEIAILQESNLLFARSAPGGGKKFTQGIDKLLKMGPQKATEFKHGRARLYPDGAQIPSKQDLQFQTALKEGAENIASAIRSSIMFCRTQGKMPKLDYNRIYISGGGARLNGLREYLEKKCGKPVQVLDLSSGLDLRRLDAASARCFEGDVPDMTIALGLAIVDADPKSFHFTLLPEKIIRQRVFWRKTVFGAAAGVVLMAGLYGPYQNAAASVDQASERAEFYEKKRKEAKAEREAFVSKVEENAAIGKKLDYYARQTRMGRVYLELFAKVRAELPPDVNIAYFGPAMDLGSGDGPRGPLGGGGPGAGSWTTGDDGVREFIVKGTYDSDVYPGTKFNEAWEIMRQKLMAVPGVVKAENEPLPASEAAQRPGVLGFQLNLGVVDPSKPLLAKAPPSDTKNPVKEPKAN